MGFYGNITNTSRTTFQFDRIYSSRQAMDDNCGNDGIYAGRYVLVEYDTELSNTDFDKDWYLVTDAQGKHIPYGSVSFCTSEEEIKHLYFNNPDTQTSFPAAVVLSNFPLKIISFAENRHFTIINTHPIYIKVRSNGAYTSITWEQFKNYYQYSGEENNLINTSIDDLENQQIIHAHIANGVAYIEDTSLFDNLTEVYAVVMPGANYTYNTAAEFWTISEDTFTKDGTSYSQLLQLSNNASNSYLINSNIDKERYRTSRGYDSTVWQKVYQNGNEKYVMIAELNTVIPTFGVSSDPPTLLPISPHFGADSTNAYYELHWQPNWGFRVKAASNSLLMPTVQPNGQLDITDMNNLDSQIAIVQSRKTDDIYYPSDQRVSWKQTFEDNTLNNDGNKRTLYFNPESQKWENDTAAKVPAAIYFNRSGFNSTKIAYSNDLISEESRTSYPSWNRYNANIKNSGWSNDDNISLTPTGLSGNVYNLHDGSIDLKPQEDTQELSIMLPSIGDTIANVWDLVYGGRSTTESIKSTNMRNKDIAWEDAKGEPARRGLRLTGIYGNEYNTRQVDTLAGSINTAHDLIGMIISQNTSAELQNPNNLDINRIYYDTDHNKYFRKHKTYDYEELDESTFNYIEQDSNTLNQEKIDSGLYYIYNNNTEEYEPATGVYNPNIHYYIKEAKTQYTVVQGSLVNFPYQNYKWYQDYLGENSKFVDDIMNDESLTEQQKANQIILKSDYILNSQYQEGKDYYEIIATPVTLQQNYTPDTYWYQVNENDRIYFKLDDSDTQTRNRVYYTVNLNRLLSLKGDRNYRGVYVPGLYYFKKTDGTFELDLTDYQTCNGATNVELINPNEDPVHQGQFKYYLLDVIKSYDSTGNEVLYRRKYEYFVVSDLTVNTFIKNIYYIQTGNNTYQLATNAFDPTETYYLQQITYEKIEDTSQVEIRVLDEFYKEDLVVYKVGTFFVKNTNNSGETIGFQEIVRADFIDEQNRNNILNREVYIFGEENGQFLTFDQAVAKNDIIQRQDNFYQSGTYHYRTEDGSYILDIANLMTPELDYFTIRPIKLTQQVTYYEPNKYYVESELEDEYELAIDATKPNSTLYSKQEYYVKEDSRNLLPKGTKWNPNALAIPPEITLATRRDRWELITIPDYSKTMGTLNGMILKMYQTIEPADSLTRSSDNVSGVINQVKDIIAKFDVMKSREIMVVDDYGRVHSASFATSQINSFDKIKSNAEEIVYSVAKDRFAEVANVNNMEKRWITINVDGNPENPHFSIHHNFQPVTNTTSAFNANQDGNAFSIYTPIVDAMGHVVGHDTKTITLPYNFGTFSISNSANNNNSITSNTQGLVAQLANDTLNISAGDRWILLAGNTNTNTLTIGHALPDTTYVYDGGQSSNATLNYGESFKTINLKADKFGHVGALNEYTITLPSISLTTNSTGTNSNAQVLTNIELTPTTGAFTYSKSNIGDLVLSGWSYNSNDNLGDLNLVATDTLLQGLAKLQRRIINEEANGVSINSIINSLNHEATGTLSVSNTITALTQVNGKVSYTAAPISITSSQVSDLSTTISTAINALTHIATGTLGVGNTITELTEVNGQINYTVSAISITSSQVSDFTSTTNGLIDSKIGNLTANNSITSGQAHLITSLSENNGIISYTSEALTWNHISSLLPTGNDAFLTVGNAASTYQPIGNYQSAGNYAIQDDNDLYVKNSDLTNALTNNVYTNTTFLWQEEIEENLPDTPYSPAVRLTIDQLISHIKVLEQKVYNLENPEPDPNSGEPEPNE